MKKSFIYTLCLCLGLVFGLGTAQAQCTPDTTMGCVAGTIYGRVCPGTLPAASAGNVYAATNSFLIPKTFNFNTADLGLSFGTIAVTVTKVIATVSGLPSGLTATFNNGTGSYVPANASSSGCFYIAGTPCDTAGTYNVALNMTVTVNVAGLVTLTLPFPLATPLPLTLTSTYPALALTAPYTHLCSSGVGSQVTVHATPGFGTYAWTPSSTTDDSLVTSAAGKYKLTATTIDGNCVFNDSITISRLAAQVSNDTTICRGSFLLLKATGGDTYAWSPSTGINSTTTANTVVLRTHTDSISIYTVTVSNGYCSDTARVKVTTHICASASTCDTCAVIPSGCTGTVPKLCSSFPAATTGTAYSQSVTFYIPDTIAVSALLPLPITVPGLPTVVVIDNAQIVVDSLPVGFDYSTDQIGNNNKYVPNLDPSFRYGCLKICGTTCGPIATNYANVSVRVELPKQLKDIVKSLKANPTVSALLGDVDTIVSIPLTGSGSLAVVAANPLTVTSVSGTDTIASGSSLSLTVNTGFTSVAWTGGSTADTLVVDTAGIYCATVTDAAGCTQTACKQIVLITGINNVALNTSLSIYPNPNDGMFSVNFSLKSNTSVVTQAFDAAGKMVYSNTFNGVAGSNKLRVDLSGVAKGIYVVKLTTAEGTVNRKVTVK